MPITIAITVEIARAITTTRTLHITSVVYHIINITLVLTINLEITIANTHTNTLNRAITFNGNSIILIQLSLQLRSRLFARYSYYYTSVK